MDTYYYDLNRLVNDHGFLLMDGTTLFVDKGGLEQTIAIESGFLVYTADHRNSTVYEEPAFVHRVFGGFFS